MKQLEPAPKATRLRILSGSLRLTRRARLDSRDVAALDDILVGPPPTSGPSWTHAECFTLENGAGVEGGIAVRRAAYEEGHEVDYDGGPRYVLKIAWVATRGGEAERRAQALVARAILEIGGDRLFLVEVDTERAARVFRRLDFTRIDRDGRWTRYAYLLREERCPPLREPETDRAPEVYLRRLSEEERRYHAQLRERTGLDVVELVTEGWTTYRGWRSSLLLVVTFGVTVRPRRTAFKIDVFERAAGAHIGYADTVVPGEGNVAFGDVALCDFPSVVPKGAASSLGGACALDVTEANDHRAGWPTREGIWVHGEYRRAGIGKAIQRVVGDVCKLVFPGIRKVSVTLPAGNSKAYEFHKKAGAATGPDGVSRVEYHLDSPLRPGIAILYGL